MVVVVAAALVASFLSSAVCSVLFYAVPSVHYLPSEASMLQVVFIVPLLELLHNFQAAFSAA